MSLAVISGHIAELLDHSVVAGDIGHATRLSDLGLESIDLILLIDRLSRDFATVNFLQWIDERSFEDLLESSLEDISRFIEHVTTATPAS